MAKIGAKPGSNKRVSALKPGLRGARNVMAAQMRASTHSRGAAFRFWGTICFVIISTIFGALWLGGYLPAIKQAGTEFKRDRLMSAGFVVNRIDVMGEGRLREDMPLFGVCGLTVLWYRLLNVSPMRFGKIKAS